MFNNDYKDFKADNVSQTMEQNNSQDSSQQQQQPQKVNKIIKIISPTSNDKLSESQNNKQSFVRSDNSQFNLLSQNIKNKSIQVNKESASDTQLGLTPEQQIQFQYQLQVSLMLASLGQTNFNEQQLEIIQKVVQNYNANNNNQTSSDQITDNHQNNLENLQNYHNILFQLYPLFQYQQQQALLQQQSQENEINNDTENSKQISENLKRKVGRPKKRKNPFTIIQYDRDSEGNIQKNFIEGWDYVRKLNKSEKNQNVKVIQNNNSETQQIFDEGQAQEDKQKKRFTKQCFCCGLFVKRHVCLHLHCQKPCQKHIQEEKMRKFYQNKKQIENCDDEESMKNQEHMNV